MADRDATSANFRSYQLTYGDTTVTRFWETDQVRIFSDDQAPIETSADPGGNN